MKARNEETAKKMPVRDLLFAWFIEHFREIADALAGSFVYLVYGVYYKGRDWPRAFSAFFIGAIFAVYVAPQTVKVFPELNHSFASFFLGLMGMRMTEIILDYDLKTLVNALITKFLKK